MAEILYVVTGATGHVGSVVAERLLGAKKRVRVVGRSADRLAAHAARGAEAAAGSLEDLSFLARAFQGAGAVFAMIPPNFAVKGFRAWQDEVAGVLGAAVEAAKVGHVVTLSSVGAHVGRGNGPIAGLHTLEARMSRVAGLAALHLRPGFFFENNLATIGLVKAMGRNAAALRPDLEMPHVATRDIGEVAARRLAALDFRGQGVLELHGQRDLTMVQVTAALGKAVGKPDLAYVQLPYPEAKKGLTGAGFPEEMADLYMEMSRGFNEGLVKPTQPRSAATTTPTSIEWFAENVFAPAFRAAR